MFGIRRTAEGRLAMLVQVLVRLVRAAFGNALIFSPRGRVHASVGGFSKGLAELNKSRGFLTVNAK